VALQDAARRRPEGVLSVRQLGQSPCSSYLDLLDAGFSYGTVFNSVGTLHVIAFAAILIAIPRIGRLQTRGDRAGRTAASWPRRESRI